MERAVSNTADGSISQRHLLCFSMINLNKIRARRRHRRRRRRRLLLALSHDEWDG